MATPQPQTRPDSSRWVSLAAICTAAGLVWLAFADFGVAVPTIADEMHADLDTLQWANNAFSLVTGALVIAAGKLGDVFGRRLMLLAGIALFALLSIVPALAPNATVLLVGRGLTGIGAALILPATLALIPPQFTGAAQLTAFGVWQAVAWGGQALAPAIGGAFTDSIGWRWLFWINLPLGALSFLVVNRLTPESKDPNASSRIDWLGLVTIGLAVFALLYALTEGPSAGWGSPQVIALFVVAVVLAVGWVLIEQRVKDPLVDLALFRLRSYDGALTANLTMNLAFGGLSYLLVLWLQNVRGFDAVTAGLLMLPSTLGIFCFIPIGNRMDARFGSRLPVLIGLVVMSAGLLVLGTTSRTSSLWLMAAGLLVTGIGLGLLSTPISNTAVGGVPIDLAGTAAGVFKMSSMVGGALGIALLSALSRGLSKGEWAQAAAAAGFSSDQINALTRHLVNSASFTDALAQVPADVRQRITDAVMTAFSAGVGDAMVITGILSLVATLVVLVLWPRRDRAAVEAGDSEPRPA